MRQGVGNTIAYAFLGFIAIMVCAMAVRPVQWFFGLDAPTASYQRCIDTKGFYRFNSTHSYGLEKFCADSEKLNRL